MRFLFQGPQGPGGVDGAKGAQGRPVCRNLFSLLQMCASAWELPYRWRQAVNFVVKAKCLSISLCERDSLL